MDISTDSEMFMKISSVLLYALQTNIRMENMLFCIFTIKIISKCTYAETSAQWIEQ